MKALKFTVFVHALAKVKTEDNDDKIQVFFTTNVLLPSYDLFNHICPSWMFLLIN